MTTKSTLLILVLGSIMVWSCQTKQTTESTQEATTPEIVSKPTLEKKWESDSTMITSESVLYSAEEGILYVSNIGGVPPTAKDGDGFISKMSLEGEILEEKWITGLDAPKGMGISNGNLYVANITELVEISIAESKITNRWPIEDAQFLNDISIDSEGNIYISDSNTNKIHMASEGTVSTWLSDSTLGGPNGLFHQGSKLMLATFGSGEFKEISTADKSIKTIATEIPGGDGVEAVGDDYLVSNWNGEIYYVTSTGEKTLLLDTKDDANSADIEYIAEKNLVLVPTFFDNKVVAYELKK